MSGTHAAAGQGATKAVARDALEADAPDAAERLAWPGAGLVILLLSAGLWFVAAFGMSQLFG